MLSLGLDNGAGHILINTSGVNSIASGLITWFNDFTCLGFSPNIYGVSDITAYIIRERIKDYRHEGFLLKTFSRFTTSGAYFMLSCKDDAKGVNIYYMTKEDFTRYMFGNIECTLSVGRRIAHAASR